MLDVYQIIEMQNNEIARLQKRVAVLEEESALLRHNYEVRKAYQRNLMRDRRRAAAKGESLPARIG